MDRKELAAEVTEQHEQTVRDYLDERSRERLRSAICEIVDAEFDRFEEYADEQIAALAVDRAERFIKRVLNGDDNAGRSLFACMSEGDRYKQIGFDAGKPWAAVYHGTLFETDGIQLRRQLVEAHADLLRNERIADLEAIVDGLRQQINKLEADNRRMLDRTY